MNIIDPDSPRKTGTDVDGKPRELGEIDSMGSFIGYIDEDGDCWESLHERDLALTAGRAHDAYIEWNRSGGVLGEEPNIREIAERVCQNPDHIEEAIRFAEQQNDPNDPLNIILSGIIAHSKARQARWN